MTTPLPPLDGGRDPKDLANFKNLISIALRLLQERFGLWRIRVTNELDAEASLYLACSSFDRHRSNGEFTEAETPEELAGQLVHIAHNRAQRRIRQEKRIGNETERWWPRDQEGQRTARDPQDSGPGPFEVALERELLETIDSIKKELDGRPRVLEIIQRCLNNMDMTQARIAVDVGVTQAMVSRKIKWFREKIRKILEESAMT